MGAQTALKHEGRAQRRQRWDRGGYVQTRIEQINKASREGAVSSAGREGFVEKGQAGLRRSQLKMQVCGVWALEPGTKKEGLD